MWPNLLVKSPHFILIQVSFKFKCDLCSSAKYNIIHQYMISMALSLLCQSCCTKKQTRNITLWASHCLACYHTWLLTATFNHTIQNSSRLSATHSSWIKKVTQKEMHLSTPQMVGTVWPCHTHHTSQLSCGVHHTLFACLATWLHLSRPLWAWVTCTLPRAVPLCICWLW